MYIIGMFREQTTSVGPKLQEASLTPQTTYDRQLGHMRPFNEGCCKLQILYTIILNLIKF